MKKQLEVAGTENVEALHQDFLKVTARSNFFLVLIMGYSSKS